MSKRYLVSLDLLNQALSQLESALNEPEENPLIVDAVIKRFEFCFELTWKTLKKMLDMEGFDVVPSPKGVLRQAYQLGVIGDESLWLNMLQDRT